MTIDDIVDQTRHNKGISLKVTFDPEPAFQEVAGDFWYYTLLPDQTLICGHDKLKPAFLDFVNKHQGELSKSDRFLGIWLNPEDNMFYIDVNARAKSPEETLQRVDNINRSSARQIIAAYNPAKDETLEIN